MVSEIKYITTKIKACVLRIAAAQNAPRAKDNKLTEVKDTLKKANEFKSMIY